MGAAPMPGELACAFRCRHVLQVDEKSASNVKKKTIMTKQIPKFREPKAGDYEGNLKIFTDSIWDELGAPKRGKPKIKIFGSEKEWKRVLMKELSGERAAAFYDPATHTCYFPPSVRAWLKNPSFKSALYLQKSQLAMHQVGHSYGPISDRVGQAFPFWNEGLNELWTEIHILRNFKIPTNLIHPSKWLNAYGKETRAAEILAFLASDGDKLKAYEWLKRTRSWTASNFKSFFVKIGFSEKEILRLSDLEKIEKLENLYKAKAGTFFKWGWLYDSKI